MEISNRLVEESLRYTGKKICLTERITELEELQKVSLYCKAWKEKLMYTSQLWEEKIEPDTTVAELLYGNEPVFDEDGRRFFQEMLEKSWQEVEDNPEGTVELLCSLGQYTNAAADMEQYIELRQKCLDEIRDPKEYTEFMRSCFPHSIFAEGVDEEFLHIKDFAAKRREITKCLVVLDKEAIDLYLKYYKNIKVAMDYLTSKLNTCAPDGHDEKVSFTFEYEIEDGDCVIKKKKEVNCSPHLKLIRDNSDLRIYFRWKDDEVAGGNKVLIGRVGRHPWSRYE